MSTKKSSTPGRSKPVAKTGSSPKEASPKTQAKSAAKPVTRAAHTGKSVAKHMAAGSAMQKFFRVKKASGTRSWAFDLGSELELAEQVRDGISTDTVDDVLSAGIIEPQVFYEHVAPRRTLTHRRETEQRLSPEQSDRFARVLRLHARAEEALGDSDRAARWLKKANRALNGARPIDLLSTDAGTRAVEKVLGRIEHGVYS